MEEILHKPDMYETLQMEYLPYQLLSRIFSINSITYRTWWDSRSWTWYNEILRIYIVYMGPLTMMDWWIIQFHGNLGWNNLNP